MDLRAQALASPTVAAHVVADAKGYLSLASPDGTPIPGWKAYTGHAGGPEGVLCHVREPSAGDLDPVRLAGLPTGGKGDIRPAELAQVAMQIEAGIRLLRLPNGQPVFTVADRDALRAAAATALGPLLCAAALAVWAASVAQGNGLEPAPRADAGSSFGLPESSAG